MNLLIKRYFTFVAPETFLANEVTTKAKIFDKEKYSDRMRKIREYCDLHYEKDLPHDEILELARQKIEWKNWNVDFPMIVDQKHKMMYCEMPKVGSTNWKRVLMKLTNPIYKNVDLMGKRQIIIEKISKALTPTLSRFVILQFNNTTIIFQK